jgi:hypothetical protein
MRSLAKASWSFSAAWLGSFCFFFSTLPKRELYSALLQTGVYEWPEQKQN